MKKYFFVLSIIIFTFLRSEAQDYKTSLGFRVGEPLGITFKQYLQERHSIELLAGMEMRGLNAACLWEFDMQKTDKKGLFYIGIGPNYIKWDNSEQTLYKYRSSEAFGVAGVLGFGQFYPIRNFPLVFSFDWMPRYDLSGNNKNEFYFVHYGFSLRFVFR